MASSGVTWFPDGELENFVRDAARLPKLDEDELEKRRQLQMRTEATSFAESNLNYLNTRNQMAMAMDPAAQQVQQQAGPPQEEGPPK
jgi:hypothetical protein